MTLKDFIDRIADDGIAAAKRDYSADDIKRWVVACVNAAMHQPAFGPGSAGAVLKANEVLAGAQLDLRKMPERIILVHSDLVDLLRGALHPDERETDAQHHNSEVIYTKDEDGYRRIVLVPHVNSIKTDKDGE